MTFEDILDEFRTLGGVAENVRRGLGPYGYGIFPIDPKLPVRLHAPEKLLLLPEDLEVCDGKLTIRAGSTVGLAERQLFGTLQEYFGWSAGLSEELWVSQSKWHDLPDDVVAFITQMGAISDPQARFAEPSTNNSLHRFVRSRDIRYNGKTHLMPVVDLVNHSSSALPFNRTAGVGVTGTFAGEVLVRYNVADCWGNLLTYDFVDPSPFAYSMALAVEVFETRLSILRLLGSGRVRDDIYYPQKRVDGNTVELSFMMLGNARQPDLPRGIFRYLMRDHLTQQQADDVFESVVRFNHDKFVEALRLLRRREAPLVRALEEAAINQLDALAAHAGARPL
ncbi:MAG TPA: hypothetical protein VGG89_02455 [Candidatus Baltobacteraceae bacterium]|jgi:hypothetical protein